MKDKVAKFFDSFNVQDKVDEFCGFYRELDDNLENPFSSLQFGIPEHYINKKNGQKYFNMIKFFRIAYSFQYFRALIKRLDEFFISVEFFQNKIEFSRASNKIPEEYAVKFFLNVSVDSIRSSLDIYAKFISCFFDLRSKNEVGFEYNKFIKPLKGINPRLAELINDLYKSDSYEYIKNLRDFEKHVGHQNYSMNLDEFGKAFEIQFDRTAPYDHQEVAYRITELFSALNQLVKETIAILNEYEFGYNSPEDRMCSLEEDFRMKDLGKLKNLPKLRFLIR